jgi:hypothetical protein
MAVLFRTGVIPSAARVLAFESGWRLKARLKGSPTAAAKPACAGSGENTRRQPSRRTWYEDPSVLLTRVGNAA